MNTERKIIQVGHTYETVAGYSVTVKSYTEEEPSELRYVCSDGMYRDKYGQAFPDNQDYANYASYNLIFSN